MNAFFIYSGRRSLSSRLVSCWERVGLAVCSSTVPRAWRAARTALLPLAVVTACRHQVRGVVSSEGSDYSPTIRVFARSTVGDSIRVHIDSGFLTAPVAANSPFAGSLMATRVSLIAHVVSTAPTSATEISERMWRPASSSTPRSLADSVRLGVPVRIPPLMLVLPRPSPFDPKIMWLVFAVQGDLVRWSRPAEPGGALQPTVWRNAISVYGCAEWNLSGKADTARSRAMTISYSERC